MTKRISLSIAVVLVIGLIILAVRINSDVEVGLGDLTLQVMLSDDDSLHSGTITMSGGTGENGDIEKSFTATPGESEILPIGEVEARVWSVQGELYNEIGDLVSSGEAELVVSSGQINTAHLVFLDQAPGLEVNVYDNLPPEKPKNVTAVHEDGVVAIRWDEVEGAVGYKVWSSNNESSPGIVLSNALIDDTCAKGETSLRAGWDVTHYYRVVAYDERGLASHPSEEISIALDLEPTNDVSEAAFHGETRHSLDSSLLYFMDADITFLMMKGIEPSHDERYYVDPYTFGYESRFYLADDKFNINRITLISDEESEVESGSFMGLYLGMSIADAVEHLQTESPDYPEALKVHYWDNNGNRRIDQIDVISTRELRKRVSGQDFYFKFFHMNIHDLADLLGDGTGAPTTLDIDKESRRYTYTITFGADEYQKVYKYDDEDAIVSMEIRSEQEEFLAVVPSLFGIKLGSQKADIAQMVSAADKTVHASLPKEATDSEFDVVEYTIIDNLSKIVFTAEVYTDRVNHTVRKVKGYFKERTVVNLNHLSSLLGEKLDGNAEITEGTGTEQWVVDFEAYSDQIIRSVAIYSLDESVFIDTVPSIYGLQLNMYAMSVPSILEKNGFRVIDEERYRPFADESLGTIKYTVEHQETKRESNVYVVTKYIGDISADVVIRIAIN